MVLVALQVPWHCVLLLHLSTIDSYWPFFPKLCILSSCPNYPLVQRWPTFWFPTFSRSMASPRILFLTMVHSSPRSGRPSVKLWCNSQFIIRLPSSDEWSDRPIRMWNLHNAARHPPPGALTSRGLNMPINPSSALPHLSLPPSVFNQRYFPVKEEEFNVLTEGTALSSSSFQNHHIADWTAAPSDQPGQKVRLFLSKWSHVSWHRDTLDLLKLIRSLFPLL